MNKTVIEYLEGYFDGQLNESISDDNIMEAFNELLETADAVAEYLNEMGPKMAYGAGAAVQRIRNLSQGIKSQGFKIKKGSFLAKKRDQAERVAKRIGQRERAAYEPNPMGPGLNQRAFVQGSRDVDYKKQGYDHLIGTDHGSGSQQMAMYQDAQSRGQGEQFRRVQALRRRNNNNQGRHGGHYRGDEFDHHRDD